MNLHKSKLATFVAALSVVSIPVYGQQAETTSGARHALMEEILVSARRKDNAESLQSVPLSVSAFGSDQLEAMFASDIGDITAVVPNANAYENATFPGYVNFYIRGMGVFSTVISEDPTVGVFVDGVYMGISAGILIDSFDMESVEILRGPQGTLFGRNVTGGAALVRTTRPTEEFHAKARALVGNDGRLELGGIVSGPLIENKLLGKLAVFHKQNDDYWDNPTGKTVGADDIGEMDQQIVRGALTWNIADTASALLRFEHGQNEADPNVWWGIDLSLFSALDGQEGILFEREPNDGGDPVSNGAATQTSDADWNLLSLEADWDIGAGTLKSITAWREFEQKNLNSDIDGSVLALFDITDSFIDQNQFSQEFVYNVPLGDSTSVTAGVFYYEQEYEYGERRTGALFPASVNGAFMGHSITDHSVTGVFAQADFQLSDRWNLTLGGRYSYEEKETQIGQFGSSESCNGLNPVQDPKTCEFNFEDDEDWSNFSPKVGIQYVVNDETQIYASWSRGFRSGGFNVRQNVGALPGPYDEETVEAYELGVKTDYFDDRVRLNGALFYNDYEDLQRTITVGTQQTVANVASAIIQGVELEGTLAPTQNLIIQASLGYIDAEIRDFLNPGNGVLIDGTQLPNVPHWQGAVNVNYDIPLDAATLTFRLGYKYTGESNSTDNNLGTKQKSHDILDASVALYSNKGWRISLYGRNLTDEVNGGLVVDVVPSIWTLGTQSTLPRNYGLELNYEID